MIATYLSVYYLSVYYFECVILCTVRCFSTWALIIIARCRKESFPDPQSVREYTHPQLRSSQFKYLGTHFLICVIFKKLSVICFVSKSVFNKTTEKFRNYSAKRDRIFTSTYLEKYTSFIKIGP